MSDNGQSLLMFFSLTSVSPTKVNMHFQVIHFSLVVVVVVAVAVVVVVVVVVVLSVLWSSLPPSGILQEEYMAPIFKKKINQHMFN